MEAAIQNYGMEGGIKSFRLEYKTHPGQAETVINSYKAHPWRIEVADQTDAAHPAPPDLPDPPPPLEKFSRGWWIKGHDQAKPANPPTPPEKIWRGKLK